MSENLLGVVGAYELVPLLVCQRRPIFSFRSPFHFLQLLIFNGFANFFRVFSRSIKAALYWCASCGSRSAHNTAARLQAHLNWFVLLNLMFSALLLFFRRDSKAQVAERFYCMLRM